MACAIRRTVLSFQVSHAALMALGQKRLPEMSRPQAGLFLCRPPLFTTRLTTLFTTFHRRHKSLHRSNLHYPGGTRTPDRRIRNPLLYPAKLLGQVSKLQLLR